MPLTAPAAVIFDCDGVLVDSEILALEVEIALLAELGLTFEVAEFGRRFLGMHDDAFRDALDEECRAVTGRPLPDDFLHRTHERRLAACEARLCEVAGAAAAVAALKTPKAVASSSTAHFLRQKLAFGGLVELFDPHIYSADAVARGKPHPDIFLHAAEQLGADPARCIAIEDSVNGVLSGKAAGMEVWGFTGGGHMDEAAAQRLSQAGAARVVKSWEEARGLFAAFA
ncbi:MAG TPA: HAD-IA family hydrolase [Caulobacteraceae bacterium]|nr:HAD-IA family hydrolase [Caulobacteraceae bacterium]